MRAALLTCLCSAAAFAGPIEMLEPGRWYRVPSSRLDALDPCPARNCSYSAVEGISAVIDDWSGGAFDTQRDRLLVWGGGHGGYAGNELYAFDLGTLSWLRLSEPSSPPGIDTMPYAPGPDGGPTSRHTYNYVQYLPAPVDRFCSFGGAGFYQDGQHGTKHVDCFDFTAARWEAMKFADTPANNLIGSITAFDPVTGRVYQHGGNQSWLSSLEPSANRWSNHGDQFNGAYVDYYKTADVDPVRRRVIAVGRNEVWSWDLTNPDSGFIPGVALNTTGATDVLTGSSPGFVYDSAVGRFVAWKGGADVYTLELNGDGGVWTRFAPDPGNTVVPTAPNGNGTFGRFRYSPARDVFVLVNAVDEDVYLYRLSLDGGVTSRPDAGAGDGGPPPGYDGGRSGDDAGTTPGETRGACGCGSAPGGALLLLLALRCARGRRRW